MIDIKFRGDVQDLEKLKEIIVKGFDEALKEIEKFVDLKEFGEIKNDFEINGNVMIYRTNFFDFLDIAIKKTYKNRLLSFFAGKFVKMAKENYLKKIEEVIKGNKLNVEIIK